MLPFVRHIARGYVGRGEPFDDLVQVGCVGLVKAIDRFDLDRGLRLSTFAAPNISGEIKRHFRDHGWSIRPPRDLQELYVKVSAATSRLSLTLGRAPTVAELAEALDATEEAVLDAIEAGRGYTAGSLDAPVEEGAPSPLDALAAPITATPSPRRARPSTRGCARFPRVSGASSCCVSQAGSRSARSPTRSACRRCTSRACCAARSRRCETAGESSV